MIKLLKSLGILLTGIIVLFLVTLPFAKSFIHIPVLQIPYIIYLNNIELTELEVHGNELHMNGLINSRSYDQIVDILAVNPTIDTLTERKIGGSLDDDTMIKLSYYVRDKGLNTKLLTDSKIYSGGVDLFLSGVERTMEDGAVIGVHSWSDGINEAKSFPKDAPEHTQNKEYIERMLGSDDFYWFTIYAAPADDIYIMENAEILKFGLLTRPIQ